MFKEYNTTHVHFTLKRGLEKRFAQSFQLGIPLARNCAEHIQDAFLLMLEQHYYKTYHFREKNPNTVLVFDTEYNFCHINEFG